MNTFTSSVLEPYERGVEFGAANAEGVRRTLAAYGAMFELDYPLDGFPAPLAAEVSGIADGAAVPVRAVAALNARTELLAAGSECSTVVVLGGASTVAVQTWDWFGALAENWLVWTIPHPDGRVVRTLTEYGIVGKIGVNSAGLGLLFNILHHEDDRPGGVPVHVLARHSLDRASDVASALALVTPAAVSASTCMTFVERAAAVSLELSPAGPGAVLPERDGVLVHTNHFLAARGAAGCRELVSGPDSFVRYDVLRRGIGPGFTEADVLRAMSTHVGGVCCHDGGEYETLATVALDLDARDLRVHPGGPCSIALASTNV